MNTPKDVLAVTGAGLAGLALFGWPVLRALQARSWPQVQGTVIRAEVEKQEGVSDGTKPRVHVEYAYTVDGTRYVASRMTFFDFSMANRRRYKPGSALVVRYAPSNPSDAVVDTSISWSQYGAVWFSALFVVGGLVTAIRLFLAHPAGVP
ncbi:MAG TPA: DUF3592 domain-containing protein [Candidatus Binatia bacterium]|jgi:hypothetical protein|nr:DUF3592 domain-containing protein [Candidatus Binatia bacterium]